ncbi:MAG: hypothetical protein ALAOOOJD_04590 [bacterium]|nr:hypothetical protein [bacterium]
MSFRESKVVRISAFVYLFLVIAPVFAGDLKIVWQPNAEADLAGYVVYYGTAERPQRHRIEVGPQTEYLLQNLPVGETYYISITAVDRTGNESLLSEQISARVLTDQEKHGGGSPQHYLLSSHPNPFHIKSNKITTLAFALTESSPVKLEIFNLLGQRVISLVDKTLTAGAQTIAWNGFDAQRRPVHTGVYWYRLQTSRQISTQRLIIYY